MQSTKLYFWMLGSFVVWPAVEDSAYSVILWEDSVRIAMACVSFNKVNSYRVHLGIHVTINVKY